jgi:hypothetical protein
MHEEHVETTPPFAAAPPKPQGKKSRTQGANGLHLLHQPSDADTRAAVAMLPVMQPVIAVRPITRRGCSTAGSAYLYVVREEPQHRQASHISCWETALRSLNLDEPAIRRHHQTGSRRISPSSFLATAACNWRRQWIDNWSHTDASLSQLQRGEHRRAHVAPCAPSPCCVHRTPRARSTLRTAARHHSSPTPSAHRPGSHSATAWPRAPPSRI